MNGRQLSNWKAVFMGVVLAASWPDGVTHAQYNVLSNPDVSSANTSSNDPVPTASPCLSTKSLVGYGSCYAQSDTLFACSFEAGFDQCSDASGCDCWNVSNGLWAAGVPDSPPGVHSGFWAAGLMLSGNYPNGADTRLVSSTMTLPALSGCENLQFRFWQWYHLSSYDWGQVEIQTRRGSVWGPWAPARGADYALYQGYSGDWTQPSIDVSSYADSTVRFSFRFTSARNGWGDPSEDRGWVVDDVLLLKGTSGPSSGIVEAFESGLGNWAATRGQWEVGAPAGSPTPHSGSACAGTVLSGNYNNGVDTRLVSPAYDLPTLGPCDALSLRFWHWYRMSSYEQGTVEISTLRDDKTWNPWSPARVPDPAYVGYSLVWTSPSLDLSSYADSTVRVGFRFTSARNGWGDPSEDLGWYVDDVEIVKGPQWTSLEGPAAWETFANGLGDWSVDGGQWEVGRPTPPPSCHSDSLCAGTVLDGNYTNGVDTRLISPPVTIGSSFPYRLWFWHWGEFSSYDAGYVTVAVKRSSGWSPWKTIDGPITGPFNDWELRKVSEDSLAAYADSTVRIGFYFTSRRNSWNDPSEAKGWYIDDVRFWGLVTDTGDQETEAAVLVVQLLPNTPNPFNPSTRIDFVLPAASQVDLSIYDVAGRLITTLVSAAIPAGRHTVTWQGRDQRGNATSSGVYIYRLRTPEQTLSKRMVLLK